MKKIFLIALALVTIQVNAQERKQDFRKGDRMERGERLKDFTPEEIAELKTKRMTLDLDLTESQQKKIQKLNLENAMDRKAKMEERQAKMKDSKEKPSKEERLAMINERLDKQIEMKKKMKNILNDEQFAKWEEKLSRRGDKKQKKDRSKRGKRS